MSAAPGLVDMLRDFLAVDRSMRRLIERYRASELRWDEVQSLFADDEGSPLFRLKERCHALFRSASRNGPVARHRGVLFDLAVGALFHEAMRFREGFYQRNVYGPRVRALRGEAGDGPADQVFREFEKIERSVSANLEEGAGETIALLDRCREQLVLLLTGHPEDGHVTRFLIEHAPEVEAVFGRGLDDLLASVHGSAAAGWAMAAGSYLQSGYFEEAERALHEAGTRTGDPVRLAPLAEYARGMAAYMAGDYAGTVAHLEHWAAAGHATEPRLVGVAHSAVSKIERLAAGDDRDRVVASARALCERIAALRGAAPA
jgi:hypothetical protein